MNQLSAMKEQDIRIQFVDCDEETVTFSNGVVLPILEFLDTDKETVIDEPVDGGWCTFGNDEVGYGYYPIKMITQEEFDEQRARFESSAAFQEGAQQARPN